MRYPIRPALLAALCAAPLAAQQPDPNDPAAAVRRGFNDVAGWVTRAAELVSADRYGDRPAQTVRTFGQLVAHIADSHNYYCAIASGRRVEWSDPIEKGPGDKATLVARLKESIERCRQAQGGAQGMGALIDNLAHTSLHYGNMVTYLRVMGLAPPSS